MEDFIVEYLQQQYEDAAHFSRIRDRMKAAPRQVVLRLSRPTDDRSVRIEGLRHKVHEWLSQEGVAHLYRVEVQPHAILDDVLTMDISIHTVDQQQPPPQQSPSPSQQSPSPPPPKSHKISIFPDNHERCGWPLTHRAVLVDRLCGEAVLRGADVFCRGILAADPGIQRNEQIAVYVNLTTKVARGSSLDRYNGACIYLGLGRSCMGRNEYFARRQGRAIRLSARPHERAAPLLPPLDDWLRDGSLFAQNLSSAVVAHILDPQPGECIFDVCGAPGGKTSHLAARARYQATIVMADRSRAKVQRAVQLFRQLGCDSCIHAMPMDGTACVEYRTDIAQKTVPELLATADKDDTGLRAITKFFPGTFDKNLLDPPCSALGLRPKLAITPTTKEQFLSFSNYQTRFLKPAVDLLKPGGTLVYSTCTLFARENEGMVQHILETYPTMRLQTITLPLGSPGLPGQGLSAADCAKVRRFDPTVTDSTGFFIAVFCKVLQ